uniref:SFRICE_004207 n=1 Tax=Spodoptera frugiperda TaxID=7108 RepID=A0A2H1VGK3_SPOFR
MFTVAYDSPMFLMSKHGNMMLMHRGYTYHLKYTRNEKSTWRCSRHCSYKCRATICTVDNVVCRMKNMHNH